MIVPHRSRNGTIIFFRKSTLRKVDRHSVMDILKQTNMLNDLSKKRVMAAVAIIAVLQCAMIFYWQGQKSNFNIDELYSFGYASSFTAKDSSYITDKEEWKFGTWMENEPFQDMLRVDESESLASLPFGEQLAKLAKKRTYMGLLNYIMYDIGEDASFYQYARGAVMLNILFFLIAELLMAYCVKKLTENDALMILSMVMFGFSGIIMGLCEFVRFYMLTIMLMLAVISLHLIMWKKKSLLKCFGLELAAFVLAYFALKHSELMLVTCGTFFCFFFIGLLCRKRFKQAAVYAVPLLLGMYYYVYEKSNLIDIVLHPADYAQPGSHGAAMVTYSLITWTAERGLACAKLIHKTFAREWFGSGYVMLAFAAVLIGFLIYRLKSVKADKNEKEKESEGYRGFIVIVLLSALMSYLFNILTILWTDRYSSFLIVLLMIAFWYLVGYIQKGMENTQFLIIIAVLAVIGAGLCQQADRMPYLYINEAATKAQVSEYNDLDSVLFGTGNRHINRHATYDCIVNTGKETKLYAVEPGATFSIKDMKALPDTFLIWCAHNGGKDQMTQAIAGSPYHVQSLGITWQNEVFLCTKN